MERLSRAWARVVYRTRIAVRARMNGRVTDPVFVLSNGRTGSYLLVDYLNCLPGVTLRGEVLNIDALVGPRRHLRTRRSVERHLRASIESLPGPIRGAKLINFGAVGLDLTDIRRLFPDARFIVLYRESLAHHYVSKLVARKMWSWGVGPDGKPFDGTVRLDPDEFRTFVSRQRTFLDRVLDDAWVRERSVVLTYEALAADPQRCFEEKVCPWLGVPSDSLELKAQRVKQNPRPLSEVVENYDEVASLLTSDEATLARQ